eukprot:gene4926-3525_t
MIKAPATAKYTTFVLKSSSKVAKLPYNDLIEQYGTR